ncbi:MAG: hypothetical protein EA369_04800 [Bradymonadales bacterium]|nr:MAG: hypothetical protein EA369_04800 [Bradymonadales bacterium]
MLRKTRQQKNKNKSLKNLFLFFGEERGGGRSKNERVQSHGSLNFHFLEEQIGSKISFIRKITSAPAVNAFPSFRAELGSRKMGLSPLKTHFYFLRNRRQTQPIPE